MLPFWYMELFLAQLLGLYFIIIGIVMFVRRRAIIPAISQLMGSQALVFILAILYIAVGLALILEYPIISLSLPGALSLIGYLMVIEGIVYLAAPRRFIKWFTGLFNRPSWYIIYAPVAIILGILFAGVGFGLF